MTSSNDTLLYDAADNDVSARKRAEIGLAPTRSTAKTTLRRPPAENDAASRGMGWLAWLLGAVILATLLLTLAKAAGAPTSWPFVRAQMQAWLNGDASSAYVTYDESLTAPYRRLIALDFSGTGAAGAVGLAEEELRGQYNLYADPQDGAYHMQVWPGNLAWSVLGKICLGPYRLETNATIGANSPDGYAGLMGRFQNARNFYLFAVNGEGAFRVSLLQDGEWRSIQPWTPSPAVHEAGKSNALALTDDGRTLVFYSNDTPLYTLDALDLPAGNVGLAAGATTTPTDVRFDWLRLYDLPCRTP